MSRKNRFITIEEVNNNINIYDVINKYTSLEKSNKGWKGLCCFHEERSQSFYVRQDGMFYCFGCGKKGFGAVDFIMKKENLDVNSAKELLLKDFTPVNKSKKQIIKKVIENKELLIDFVDCNFNNKHNEYWEHLEMDQKWLNSKNVFATVEVAIGIEGKMSKVKMTKDEIMFVYYAPEIQKCKVLRIGPQITKEMKWRTNIENTYLWYYNDYVKNSPHDLGFIVKSNKDALVLQKLGRKAIATQNESSVIMLNNNVDKINTLFTKSVVNFGTDAQGKKESILITKETGWSWFNIQNNLYEQYKIEDNADFLNAGFKYSQLERMLKNKGI